ncbi:CLUMA_CG020501, isoform A [Clunio marinus]|uniref:CLUMA_CG020501, isoform A n=1 Tax=Clunio marinus TaxID=568069 RepID=A0A1J1J556_9DIPT|nr:CLUMA_CG020501, isoform A [Clunio marinus]
MNGKRSFNFHKYAQHIFSAIILAKLYGKSFKKKLIFGDLEEEIPNSFYSFLFLLTKYSRNVNTSHIIH